MARVGELEVKVQWDENKSKLRGLTRSHNPGDSFLAGKTTNVTYESGGDVVCVFNVTVEAEGMNPEESKKRTADGGYAKKTWEKKTPQCGNIGEQILLNEPRKH